MNALEKKVRKIADELHEHQVLRLYKIPNDIKIAGDQLIHGDQVPADFIGFTATARAMLVECKITSRGRLDLSKKGLKPHQLQAILEVQRAGGLGLVVWQFEERIAVIDADQVRSYSEGRRSIPWQAIPYRYKKTVVSNPLTFFEPHVSCRR